MGIFLISSFVAEVGIGAEAWVTMRPEGADWVLTARGTAGSSVISFEPGGMTKI